MATRTEHEINFDIDGNFAALALEIQEMKDSLKTANQETKGLSKGFTTIGLSIITTLSAMSRFDLLMGRLGFNSNILGKSINLASKSAESLASKTKITKFLWDSANVSVDKFETKLADTEVTSKRLKSNLSKLSTAYKSFIDLPNKAEQFAADTIEKSEAAVGRQLDRVGEGLKRIGADKYAKVFKGIKDTATRATNSLEQLSSTTKLLSSRLKTISAVFGKFSNAVTNATKRTVNFFSNLPKIIPGRTIFITSILSMISAFKAFSSLEKIDSLSTKLGLTQDDANQIQKGLSGINVDLNQFVKGVKASTASLSDVTITSKLRDLLTDAERNSVDAVNTVSEKSAVLAEIALGKTSAIARSQFSQIAFNARLTETELKNLTANVNNNSGIDVTSSVVAANNLRAAWNDLKRDTITPVIDVLKFKVIPPVIRAITVVVKALNLAFIPLVKAFQAVGFVVGGLRNILTVFSTGIKAALDPTKSWTDLLTQGEAKVDNYSTAIAKTNRNIETLVRGQTVHGETVEKTFATIKSLAKQSPFKHWTNEIVKSERSMELLALTSETTAAQIQKIGAQSFSGASSLQLADIKNANQALVELDKKQRDLKKSSVVSQFAELRNIRNAENDAILSDLRKRYSNEASILEAGQSKVLDALKENHSAVISSLKDARAKEDAITSAARKNADANTDRAYDSQIQRLKKKFGIEQEETKKLSLKEQKFADELARLERGRSLEKARNAAKQAAADKALAEKRAAEDKAIKIQNLQELEDLKNKNALARNAADLKSAKEIEELKSSLAATLKIEINDAETKKLSDISLSIPNNVRQAGLALEASALKAQNSLKNIVSLKTEFDKNPTEEIRTKIKEAVDTLDRNNENVVKMKVEIDNSELKAALDKIKSSLGSGGGGESSIFNNNMILEAT